MSGVSAANSRRASRHIFIYALVAAILFSLFLPYDLLALAIALLASLHFSVNHGASVLPHLLGFFGLVILISLTTPALTASSSIKFSTAEALSVLFRALSATRAVNLVLKSSESVYSVHFYADVA
jgi:hypothetical protein